MDSGNDKDLKIGIKADTADAEKATRALEGVKQAAEGAAAASAKVRDFSGTSTQDLRDYKNDYRATGASESDDYYVAVLDELAKREKALAEETAKATKEIKEQEAALAGLTDEEAGVIDLRKKNAKATDEVADSTKKVTEETKQLRSILLLQGLSAGAEIFGKWAVGLQQTSQSLKATNPELAETAATASKVASALSAAAGGAATGMPFGPLAAGIGAVTGLLLDLGTAADENLGKAEEAAEKAAQKMRDYVSRLQDASKEAEKGAFKRFAEDVEAGTEVLARQNEELERNLRLTKEKIAAEGAVDRADTERRIAEVEASDFSPEEKIRKVAALRDAQAQRDSGRKIEGLNAGVAADEERLRNSQQEVRRRQEATRDLQQQLEIEEAKQRDIDKAKSQLKFIEGEGGDISRSSADVAAAEKRVNDLNKVFSSDTFLSTVKALTSLGTLGAYDYDANKEREKRQQELDAAMSRDNDVRVQAQALRPIAGQSASVEDARKRLEESQAAERKAGDDANRLGRQLQESRARRDLGVEVEGRTTASQQAARAATAEAAARREVDRKQDEALRKAQQDFRKNEQLEEAAERARASASKGLEDVAMKGEGIARKQLGPQAAGYFEKVSNALGDGASSAEVKELIKLLEALSNQVDGKSATGRDVRELQKKVRELEGKLNRGGDVKDQ